MSGERSRNERLSVLQAATSKGHNSRLRRASVLAIPNTMTTCPRCGKFTLMLEDEHVEEPFCINCDFVGDPAGGALTDEWAEEREYAS